jgi:hypothetical protein
LPLVVPQLLAQGQKPTPGSSSTQIFTCELRQRVGDSSVMLYDVLHGASFVQMMTVSPTTVRLRHTAHVHMTEYIATYHMRRGDKRRNIEQWCFAVGLVGKIGLSSARVCNLCACVWLLPQTRQDETIREPATPGRSLYAD